MGPTENLSNTSVTSPSQINGDSENFGARTLSSSQHTIDNVASGNNFNEEKIALLRVISNALDTLSSIPSQHHGNLGDHHRHSSVAAYTLLPIE